MPEEKTPDETDKSERRRAIFQAISNAPAVATEYEAYELVARAFSKAESKLEDAGKISKDDKMTATGFDSMRNVTLNGKTVRADAYAKHALFIASNGAIEIRRFNDENDRITRRTLVANPTYIETATTVELEKPGTDGKKVWE